MFCGAILLLASMACASSSRDIVALPQSYRSWELISVAHEAGALNDLRAILGNAIAVNAMRTGTRPFPDGAMIVRIAWEYQSSPKNDAAFANAQSFVAGRPTNVQLSVKDSKRYAASGGWGFGQFESGRLNPDAALAQKCVACHRRLDAADDMVFTSWSP